MPSSGTFPILRPDLQVAFSYRIQVMRDIYLSQALRRTVEDMDITLIDRELASYVSKKSLQRVAGFGLRGEVVFAVPCVLATNPYLLGYYRLLYGLSQKEFYNAGPFGRFIGLEERGEIPARVTNAIPALCRSLATTGALLVEGVDALSLERVHELQLLTVGPYLRGSENTRIGQQATQEVMGIVKRVVASALRQETRRTLLVENASNRTVMIEFGSDPDVRVEEMLASGARPLVSMEIKGGTDASNIHNRLGEAEKSHQKARAQGFFEFWTLVRCDVAPEDARRESPTTSRFFHIDGLSEPGGPDYAQFRDLLCSIIGIPVGDE